MKIYMADIRALANRQALLEKCELISKERREQIQKLRKSEDKQRSIGAGLLLEYGLRQYGYTLCETAPDMTRVHLASGQYGKPYLMDAEGLYFNLSHSGDYVAAVFAECEAGIDVEQIRTANLAVARRFFTEEEYGYLEKIHLEAGEGDRLNLAFSELWTRKECYIKAVGEGMHLPLTDFCVLSDEVGEKERYCLKTWVLPENCALSVCAKGAIEAELTRVDLMKII